MKGVYDVHVHASPSIFNRWGDAAQTAEACQAAGMSGIVLKAHHGSTTELANELNKKFEINVFGGVVLNYFVGGLNPYAVDACCALGGKIVWLPTIHAAAHKPLGRFEFQEPKTKKFPEKGIRIAQGKDLVGPMSEILKILHNKKVVLGTGHVSAEEIKILVNSIQEKQVNVRILVNHAHFYTPAINQADVEKIKGKNTWFEVSHFSQMSRATSIEKMAQTIKDHPDANWVMASDSGQPVHKAPQALKAFKKSLLKQGIHPNQLDQMMRISPIKLLY
ncbi:hypothetical protein KGY73_10345 [bacterium]|nr:hypothetical protein [bacterium]